MLKPSVDSLKLLFDENPDMNLVLVTDCVEPVFQADVHKIESEPTFKTHIQGAFCVQRQVLDKLTPCRSHASSWTELFATLNV
jgi:hypothetical protein